MGLFKKRATDPDELDNLRSEIAAMAARLDAADAEKAHVEHRISQLATRVDQPASTPLPPPSEVSQSDLDMMRARIQRLSDRLDDPALTSHDPAVVEALESRVDQLAAELAAATAPTIDPDEYASLHGPRRGAPVAARHALTRRRSPATASDRRDDLARCRAGRRRRAA